MTQSSTPSARSASITLPDGRSATVRAFSGNVQKILSDQKRMLEGDGIDAVVREVAQVNGKPLTTIDVKALRVGSRDAILIAARRRTYGDEVKEDDVPCRKCGERNQLRVDLAAIESVPYPEGDIHLTVDGHSFVLGWLTARDEAAHAEGVRRGHWGAMDDGLLAIKTLDGERVGPKAILDLPGDVLDAVRRAVRYSTPLHRTEPDRDPVALEPPFDTIPVGGTATRIEWWCSGCGARNLAPLAGMTDFLFRGLRSLAD